MSSSCSTRLKHVFEIEGVNYTHVDVSNMSLSDFKTLISFLESKKDLELIRKYLPTNQIEKRAYVFNLLDNVGRM
jgi:hypothetical protein